MLKLPKGLKKKKKKSKKDQELFTEEELEQYKREIKAKQEAAAAKSDAGESDGASDAEGLTPQNKVSHTEASSGSAVAVVEEVNNGSATAKTGVEDEEWAKFKALTSGVDTILHKTQDELDRIKKESFYQRLPSAVEKQRLEEEEAAKREAARLEEEKRLAAEKEAKRDKLAEAVVELSDSGEENDDEVDDLFVTDYVEAITSGEVQLVIPDSPIFEEDNGPDPFDTEYAEKVIVGADKAKGNKKLVSLGAAVEVLSGRVDREHALSLAKPKRKQRKGIQNLLLSESVDYDESEIEIVTPEPPRNLLDELVAEGPESEVAIDLSVSLHLHLIQPKKNEEEEAEQAEDSFLPDLSEFDTLKDDEDDEFAELAAESLTKKEEVKVIKEISLPPTTVLGVVEGDWAEFESIPEEQKKDKPARPPRPNTGPHIVPGAIYISDEEDNVDDDPFNTTYAEFVIKKTTVLDADDDFDPRAEEKHNPPPKPPPPASALLTQPTRDLLAGSNTDLSKIGATPIAPTQASDELEDYDPFDTSTVNEIVQPKCTELKFIERELLTVDKVNETLSDDDFDPRAEEPTPVQTNSIEFDINRRKSSLSLNLQQKSVGFLVPSQDLLATSNGGAGNKKPLTPYYVQTDATITEKEIEDPFDTTYVAETKPTAVELKHIEQDLLQETSLKHSLSDPDFNPRAPPTPIPAEDLLTVKENIGIKVLTPAQESKDFADESPKEIDPFDTSIAGDLKPGQIEIKLLESELLPQTKEKITTGVLDTETDAQELGLGAKVLTPLVQKKKISVPEDIDPFDTSIAENLAPGETEIKLLESELIN